MKKMFSRSWKVWTVSALLFGCVAGVLYKVSPFFFSTLLPVEKNSGERLSFQPSPSAALPLAPPFAARTLDGKAVGSAQLAGKAYIVNFFASWCPPCRSEIPDMVLLQKKYESKGFTFIGVAVNENVTDMRAFITKNQIGYPVFMSDDKIVSAFSRYVAGGLTGIPTSFVVNTSGRITLIITGGRSKEAFEKIIVDALKKPELPQ